MKECAYSREPLDLKLMCLLMMKKIWLFLLAAAAGALVVSGVYYVLRILPLGGVTYEATSTYYVDYGTDPLTDNEFTYINAVTWDTVWVKSDEFVAQVLDRVGAQAKELTGETLTAERLKGYLSADLPSDLRVPTTTVKTESRELTMLLVEAVEQTMAAFGADPAHKEMNEIRVVISPEQAQQTVIDNRTWSAAVLGGLLGLFLAVVTWLIGYFFDDSVYVPSTFEYRYGVPMLGTMNSPYTKENYRYFFGERAAALLCVDAQEDAAAVVHALEEKEIAAPEQLTAMPGLEQCPEILEHLRKQQGLLLGVTAGAHDGKRIEEQLTLLRKQGIEVTAALLLHEEEGLQRAYYFPGYGGKRG